MSQFPTAEGFEIAGDDEHEGEVLHPGANTVVDRSNNPLQKGETVRVWFQKYDDTHGKETVVGDLVVIDDDDESDIFAIPEGANPLTADRLYRIESQLDWIQKGSVRYLPNYDHENGLLHLTRDVITRGSAKNTIIEARSLGNSKDWYIASDGV